MFSKLFTIYYSLFTARKGFISELVRRHNYRAKRDGFIFALVGKHSPRGGFTLIEILVVITIIALLAGVSAAAFNNFNRSQRLAQGAKELETVLKEAQSRTLSSVEGRNWGVHLVNGSSTAEIFSIISPSNSYNVRVTTLTRNIGESVVVSAMRLGNPNSYLSPTTINAVFSVGDGSVVFVNNAGTCPSGGGSADSACSSQNRRCLSIRVNLQGGTDYRYLKVNERNIFESATLTPCP